MGGNIQMFTNCRVFTIIQQKDQIFDTLHNFFTGAHDKVADNVVNRICRDNNKPLGSNDPRVKLALIALDSGTIGA